jgi:hypothetical protein
MSDEKSIEEAVLQYLKSLSYPGSLVDTMVRRVTERVYTEALLKGSVKVNVVELIEEELSNLAQGLTNKGE